MKTSSDTSDCCISDIALLEDGSIILADQNNRCLKKLSPSFGFKAGPLKLPGRPVAVCVINTEEVAVSLPFVNKAIQLASVANPMKLTHSFKIGESCRGIAYSDGRLFLSCGGMTKFNDGPGEIRIYATHGTLLKSLSTFVGIPKRMTSPGGKNHVIFVADEKSGVLRVGEKNGEQEVRQLIANDGLKADSPTGICHVDERHLLVGGCDSHNVVLLSKEGERIAELLNTSHGLRYPKSLCLNKTGSKLIIGMKDCNVIKVFSVKKE